MVTYQCYPGYQVVGAELLMCQWDLTWSGDLPSCERGEYKNTISSAELSTWDGEKRQTGVEPEHAHAAFNIISDEMKSF